MICKITIFLRIFFQPKKIRKIRYILRMKKIRKIRILDLCQKGGKLSHHGLGNLDFWKANPAL